jgi:hypothetical protein
VLIAIGRPSLEKISAHKEPAQVVLNWPEKESQGRRGVASLGSDKVERTESTRSFGADRVI